MSLATYYLTDNFSGTILESSNSDILYDDHIITTLKELDMDKVELVDIKNYLKWE